MRGFIVVLAAFVATAICAPHAAAQSDLSVDDASIALGIEELSPVDPGEFFSSDVGRLWCYSKVSGGGEGDSIVHNWYYGDELMAEVSLPIRSPSYRTYSSKNIVPGWTGEWRVEITDAEGMLLETLNFTVETTVETVE
jgi:hypothetical protein